MSNGIAKDLSRHLQQQLGDVLERNLRLAQLALSQRDVAEVMLEAAVSTLLSIAASCATPFDEEKRPAFFESTIDLIAGMAKAEQARAMAKIQKALEAPRA